MIGKASIFIVVIMMLTIGMSAFSEAATNPDPVRMQRHIDKVKVTHPQRYQEMMERAGGVVNSCISCHRDMKTKKGRAGYSSSEGTR